MGPFLRRGGAFFLRRTFKGDRVYTAVFKAYLKKLVHDGIHHEFFPEGGRSRTGKLLQPKLGLFTWLVDAVLEGARDELLFVPIAIDYEKVVEGAQLLGGADGRREEGRGPQGAAEGAQGADRELRPHSPALRRAGLAGKSLMRERGLDPRAVSDDEKRGLVRALGHRVMYGINRVSTVTPHALLASALLAHRRRGISEREVTDRMRLLRPHRRGPGRPALAAS